MNFTVSIRSGYLFSFLHTEIFVRRFIYGNLRNFFGFYVFFRFTYITFTTFFFYRQEAFNLTHGEMFQYIL